MTIIRMTVLFLALLLPLPADAAQSGGSGGGGLNFACEGTTCICNGSYLDCKSMEDKCSGKINCPAGASYCSCTKKASVRRSPLLPRDKIIPDSTLQGTQP
jgi:hypothetical protein